MAKLALINRERKARKRWWRKFAAKRAELVAVKDDQSVRRRAFPAARLKLQRCRATRVRPACATAAR
jgi:hypothetical protein